MTQSSLPRPPYSSSDDEYKSDVEDYQVDTCSTSSCKEIEAVDENDDDELQGTIVVPGQIDIPNFGSVSVVNSNDVHFGNKTVYKGPVTIKQFVYPNGDISCDSVGSLSESDKKIDLSNGVNNHGFVRGDDVHNNHSRRGIVEQEDVSRIPETAFRKGYLWLKNIPKRWPTGTMIVLTVIVLSVTVISAIILWRNPVTAIVIPQNKQHSPNSEEDNDKPIYYPTDSNETISIKVRILSRLQWLAQPPIEPTDDLKVPVSMVIIQHTATESCYSQAQCIYQTRHIQTFHIESNGWFDIGYNFLVGGDGAAYEGRGWKKEGAHTFGWNNRSLGVGFIGTFISKPPPKNQIDAFHKLLAKGVELGILTNDYKILAARQLYATESPGKSFYEIIKTWDHWSEKP
ncbi:hypothetical protein JTB14_038159 [Gonioctena quinquepunctata]|nr:hypothetical protein JTB14_038159 [Gonioctena quinquepunctata]